MFDLKNHTYQEVVDFLAANYEKRDVKPCCNVNDSNRDVLTGASDSNMDSVVVEDEYELFVVTLDDQYFDNGGEIVEYGSTFLIIVELAPITDPVPTIDCGKITLEEPI